MARCGIFLCGLILVSGCTGNAGPAFQELTGRVTFESEPIESGDIIFTPNDGSGSPPCGAPIVNGEYKAKVYPGEFKVSINASRDTGEMKPGPSGEDIPVREDYIPAKYNSKTELVTEVAAGSKEPLDFELTDE